MTADKTRVLVVEDEPAIAQDLAACLEELGYVPIGPANSADRAKTLLDSFSPDIALLDISIKGDKTGIDLAHTINKQFNIPFVYLTSFSDKMTVEKARETYPYGYIVKPFKQSDLAPAIEIALVRHEAKQGSKLPKLQTINSTLDIELSKMEYTILERIWEGKKNKEIADVLFLSINTIKSHCYSLYRKLGVTSRGEVISKIRKVRKS